MKLLKAEFLKLRKSKVLLSFFVLPVLSAVFGTFNYAQNLGVLKDGWYSLWTQHTLFLSYFFLPVLIGLIVSYSFRLEEGNWNNFAATPVKRGALIAAKFTVCSGFALLAMALTAVLFLGCGLALGLEGFPLQILSWILQGSLGIVSVVAVQVLLSLWLRNFALPVGLALLLGIAGLMLITVDLWFFTPYTLIAVGLQSNGSDLLDPTMTVAYLVLSVIFTAIALLLSCLLFRTRDVRN